MVGGHSLHWSFFLVIHRTGILHAHFVLRTLACLEDPLYLIEAVKLEEGADRSVLNDNQVNDFSIDVA